MGFLDKFKGHEGSSGDYGKTNTVSDDDWQKLQRQARKHAPHPHSDEGVARSIRGRDNFRNRENN